MERTEFLILLSVVVSTMLVMAGAIILFVVFYQKRMIQEQLKRQILEFEYQDKMMKAELESQESERKRLAADLHDSIGSMLSTIRVGLVTIGKTLPNPSGIDQTKRMLDDTISSVRRISSDLMPATLEKFGLVYALQELCERFQATSQINMEFNQPTETIEIEKQRQLMIFRIVQELLNNAIKHAQASLISVTLDFQDEIVISVSDNGVGFNPDDFKNNKEGKGLGLYNIDNRTRLLGGKIEVGKSQVKGSKTILTIPLVHEKAN